MLAAGDLDTARGAVDDLTAFARSVTFPYLDASVASLSGAVELAAGDPSTASPTLASFLRRYARRGTPVVAPRADVTAFSGR